MTTLTSQKNTRIIDVEKKKNFPKENKKNAGKLQKNWCPKN